MKRRTHNRIQISCAEGLYLYLALLALLIPLRLLAAASISAVIHELFHIGAIRFVGKKILAIYVGPRGAVIHTQCLNGKEELLCALAGPLGSMLLLLFFRWMPIIALTGAVQAMYNLLPLYPTDGGRALVICMHALFSEDVAFKIVYWTEAVTLSILTAICVYASIKLCLGIIPIAFAGVLLFRWAKRK